MFYMLQEQLARFVISARYFILSSNTSNLNVFHLQDAECTLTLSSRTFLSTEDASAVMMRKYQRHYSPRKEAPDRILKELEELHAILLKFNTKQLISPQQINLSDASDGGSQSFRNLAQLLQLFLFMTKKNIIICLHVFVCLLFSGGLFLTLLIYN